MCKWNKWGDTRIDPCMREFMKTLNIMLETCSFSIVACCCGHRKYPMTIVVKDYAMGKVFDLVSSKTIHRKKKFYKRDKQGVYYIPEVINGN